MNAPVVVRHAIRIASNVPLAPPSIPGYSLPLNTPKTPAKNAHIPAYQQTPVSNDSNITKRKHTDVKISPLDFNTSADSIKNDSLSQQLAEAQQTIGDLQKQLKGAEGREKELAIKVAGLQVESEQLKIRIKEKDDVISLLKDIVKRK